MDFLGLVDVLWNTYTASRGVPLVHIPRYLTRCLWTGCYMLFLSGCSNIVSGVLWLLPLLGFTHSLERVLPGFVMQMVGYDVAFLAWFYVVRQLAEVLFRTACIAIDRVRGWEQGGGWGMQGGGGGGAWERGGGGSVGEGGGERGGGGRREAGWRGGGEAGSGLEGGGEQGGGGGSSGKGGEAVGRVEKQWGGWRSSGEGGKQQGVDMQEAEHMVGVFCLVHCEEMMLLIFTGRAAWGGSGWMEHSSEELVSWTGYSALASEGGYGGFRPSLLFCWSGLFRMDAA